MPCYTINIVSVEFKPENFALLTRAAAKLGWVVRQDDKDVIVSDGGVDAIVIREGSARGNAFFVNQLRVGYAKEVMSQAQAWAKSKGWQTQKLGENKVSIFKGG